MEPEPRACWTSAPSPSHIPSPLSSSEHKPRRVHASIFKRIPDLPPKFKLYRSKENPLSRSPPGAGTVIHFTFQVALLWLMLASLPETTSSGYEAFLDLVAPKGTSSVNVPGSAHLGGALHPCSHTSHSLPLVLPAARCLDHSLGRTCGYVRNRNSNHPAQGL